MKPTRSKGTKVMVLTNGSGAPLSVGVYVANHAEMNLIEPLIDDAVTPHASPRLIYDRAAESDPLRERLAQRGIDLVCPHRKSRVRQAMQDGRNLRRYRRRWKTESTIAWLHSFRRIATHHEFYAFLSFGFLALACQMIAYRLSCNRF